MKNEEILRDLKLPFLLENKEEFLKKMKKEPSKTLDWWLQNEVKDKNIKRLESRLKISRLGVFKKMREFDWDWPEELNKSKTLHITSKDFVKNMRNVLLLGPEGLGKTMIAKNIAYEAIQAGFRSLFVTASSLINDLNSYESGAFKEKTLKKYTTPHVLVIDEIGYVKYDQKSAFNLFEVVSRRYEKNPTVVTTNLAFKDWSKIFPDAGCVTSLVDRLFHHSILLQISGKSYRLHEHKKEQELGHESKQKSK